ncbi:zinc finger BED domain-containing protein 4-like [Haematobia irritans]|uniref:zinc finger BED domain-containing protein 4-like n=1 Tax=Haematobia irritans TaxID=7368 RepID=UPI003F500073
MPSVNLIWQFFERREDKAKSKERKKYKVKSEKFFRDLMHVTYDNVKKKIMDKVSKAKWISFTTDIWTSTGKTCSLWSFTAHLISEGKKEKVILGAADMSKNHKASYIFEKLSEIIKDFELEGRIHVGVSDNAGNMVAAMKLGDIKHFGCVSHTLQLAIHDAFNKNVQLKSLIEKCRKIVSHFKKSEKASRTFKSIQKECGLPDHRLLQDVSVRWNSSYIMMERLVEQSAAVNLYAAKYDGISVISAESFYEATLDICSDDSCTKTILKNFKKQLQLSLEERFAYISTNNCLIIATLLDPRFKNKYLNKDQTKLAVNELKDSFDFDVYDNIEFVPVKTPIKAQYHRILKAEIIFKLEALCGGSSCEMWNLNPRPQRGPKEDRPNDTTLNGTMDLIEG